MAQRKDPLGMMATLKAIQNSGPESPTSGARSLIKISAWLSESIDSHDIADHEGMAKDFRERTGLEPCWPVHSRQNTIDTMARRGLGGHIGEGLGANAWGYEVAQALATKYAPGYRCTKMGRGFIYREALEALQAAGV